MRFVVGAMLAVLCLFPLSTQGLNIQQHVKSLQSLQDSVINSFSRRRILQDNQLLTSSFASAATLFDHECWSAYNSELCTYNNRVLLSTDAPEPLSEAGKWLAKLTAASYLCELHETEEECLSDTANSCVVVSSFDVQNAEDVQVCSLSRAASRNITNQFFLCPGSIMQKIFICNDLQVSDIRDVPENVTISNGCISGQGASCVFVESVGENGECLPQELVNNYNLTDDASIAKLNADIDSVSEAVWGCCPGATAYAKQQACALQLSQANCTGACKWTLDNTTEVPAFYAELDPPCVMKNDAVRDLMLADVNTDFANYLRAVEARCQKFNDSVNPLVCYNTTAIKNGPSDQKAVTYSGLQLMSGGGENPTACGVTPAPPVATDNTTVGVGSGGTLTTNSSSSIGSVGGVDTQTDAGQVSKNATAASAGAMTGPAWIVVAALSLVLACVLML